MYKEKLMQQLQRDLFALDQGISKVEQEACILQNDEIWNLIDRMYEERNQLVEAIDELRD